MELRTVIKKQLHNAVSLRGLAKIADIEEKRMRLIGDGALPTKQERSAIREAFKTIQSAFTGHFEEIIKS